MSTKATRGSRSAARGRPAGPAGPGDPGDPGPVVLSDQEREVARALLVHGPTSRAQLSRRLGLSAASLTRLGKPLLDAGIASESDLVLDGSVGRPVRLLDIRQDARFFVGIKLTGTSAQGVLTDLRANCLARGERELPGHGGEQVLGTLEALAAELRVRSGKPVAGIGISIGGQVSGGTLVERAPFLGWRNVPLGELLRERTGLPVLLENDVTALVAAEQWFGVGRVVEDFAVVTLGAGIGYGLAMGGKVVRGRDTGLGLGGHFPIDPTGPWCPAGHRGCSTAMFSIPGICAQVSAALGREVGYAEVFGLAEAGDPAASAVLRSAAHALGRFLAAAANLAMVNTVVLGGEGIELFTRYGGEVRSALSADRDPEAGEVRLEVLGREFDQWARGAAAVAIREFAFA